MPALALIPLFLPQGRLKVQEPWAQVQELAPMFPGS
jgi:hypothetical protein